MSDRHHTGRSQSVPYLDDESPSSRHDRRLSESIGSKPKAMEWCKMNPGATISIHNGGQHWCIKVHPHVVEWWPSSAKCVVDKAWGNSIHVHDVVTLTILLDELISSGWNVRKAVGSMEQSLPQEQG